VSGVRLAAIIACLSSSAAAQEPVSDTGFGFDGSFRTRYESKQDFDFNGGDQTYLLTRIRLAFNYRRERSNFYLQLQDARIFGESREAVPPINDSAVPTVFADQLDFHQAYFEHDFAAVSLRAGRQKFNLADQRLVASLEWVNTARVHDGIRLTFGDPGTRQLELFASALVAVDPDHLNDQSDVGNRYMDSDFHGAFVTDHSWSVGQLEYWYFYRDNGNFSDKVSTIGTRLVRELGLWQLDLQGAYQFGDFDGLDHSAYMFHAGLNGEFSVGRWSAAYNMASGDDDPNDGDHGTFDNLYPLNHPYYGYMDLFSLQNVHNLELAYARSLGGRASLRLSLQGFWLNEEDTDAWYNAGLAVVRRAEADVDSYVGSELDITATLPLIPQQLTLVAGLSRFFGGSYLGDTGAEGDANFFFLQLSWTP